MNSTILESLDPAWITAISCAVIAFLILILVIVLGRLVSQLRRGVEGMGHDQEHEKRQRTLDAVRRYETDPQLREAIKQLYEKTDQGTDYTRLEDSDRFNVITLLNYFDGIACGIAQGMLIESLARDYLQFVLDKAVKALLRGESSDTWVAGPPMVPPDGYETLLDLHQRWVLDSNRSLYEMLR